MLMDECGGTPAGALRIYVCGPCTARCDLDRLANLLIAVRVGLSLVLKGHHVHVPQSAAWFSNGIETREHARNAGLTFIECWAQAVYVAERGAASDREIRAARRLGLPIWSTISEVPTLPGVRIARRLERQFESPECLEWLYRRLSLGPANAVVRGHLLGGRTLARLERALFEHVDLLRVLAAAPRRSRAASVVRRRSARPVA